MPRALLHGQARAGSAPKDAIPGDENFNNERPASLYLVGEESQLIMRVIINCNKRAAEASLTSALEWANVAGDHQGGLGHGGGGGFEMS
jgi:hypothetical protein